MKQAGVVNKVGLLPCIMFALSGNLMAAEGKDVIYQVDGLNYEGFYMPSAQQPEKSPLVLLIHDWDGLTDYEKQRAAMLSDLGYNVFAADLFGQGIRPVEVKDKRQHTGELYKDRNKMRQLMQGAIRKAVDLGADSSNAVAMGYCFGGAAVLELARSGQAMKGFVTFHGGLKTPDGQNYQATQGKLLVLHGTADTAIPMIQFAALATELESSAVAHEMITYSGAPHAFTVFGSPRYREEADQKSWKRFTEFLQQQTR
ncbi:dienelactone hydrolase family protein [Oceanospirillum sediminis]|uniref:Dienelactone hydrolase family protein n=1 Tax=Oceanospirillum sediminis TaxID=2760088 RepID=A0A839IIH7_9GAMM|nr:dienelactone hydrolase family protein [Oceanospirillum sediminis]MBB1485133.1 dienelactone hydrolase family protein [Oceanospirillum sediminis]